MSETSAFSVSATDMSASGTTNGLCQKGGPYKSNRNTTIVVFFKAGQRFPVDPTDGRSTTWSIVTAR
ncbi:MAG TPA: hypothetical protein VNH22_10640 [Blastocatellia bacterium]|jgi:hypothetical protein|nr:hypothetical protein [Blastocatellia bacterium]